MTESLLASRKCFHPVSGCISTLYIHHVLCNCVVRSFLEWTCRSSFLLNLYSFLHVFFSKQPLAVAQNCHHHSCLELFQWHCAVSSLTTTNSAVSIVWSIYLFCHTKISWLGEDIHRAEKECPGMFYDTTAVLPCISTCYFCSSLTSINHA